MHRDDRRLLRFASRWVALGLACTLIFSGLVSMAVLLLKYLAPGRIPALPTLAVALGIFSLWAFFKRAPMWLQRPRRVAILLAAFLLCSRAALVLWVSDYPQEADCAFFRDTVETLAEEGWNRNTIVALSRIYYDDYLWIGRALPLHLPLRLIFGPHHVRAAQLANVLLSCLMLPLLASIATKVLPLKGASAAVLLFALLPVHSWLVLDYTHQILGAFLVLAAVALAFQIQARWTQGQSPWGTAVLLGLVLLLLHLQGGIDMMLILAICVLPPLHMLRGKTLKTSGRLALFLVVLPLVIYLPPSRLYSSWSASYKPIRMSSHPISFTARRWSLETGGEYDGKYEQLDREAPYPRKAETMRRLIASQFHYHPWRTSFELPAVKAGKFFLIGYATGIDHRLLASGHPSLADAFLVTRLFLTPIFLGFCIVGCYRLWCREEEDPATVWLTILPLLIFGIYLIAGETSPRYSFHIHSVLALLAGFAFVPRPASLSYGPATGKGAMLLRDLLLLLLCALLAGLTLVGVSAHIPADRLFLDMRQAQWEASTPATTARAVPRHLAPFESWLDFSPVEGATFALHLHLPERHAGSALSFYVWPGRTLGDREIRFQVEIDGEEGDSWSSREVGHVFRREVRLPRHATVFSLQGVVEAVNEASIGMDERIGLLRWGYVALHRESVVEPSD